MHVYEFAGEAVSLSATSPEVVVALQGILRPAARGMSASPASTSVAALLGHDGWQLEVDGNVVRGLAAPTPIPRVAEEVIAAACSAVASKRSNILVSGALLEKDGAAIALVGDDLDAAKVLGFHLHARGWAAVSFGYAFVSGASLEVLGLRALASVSASTIDQIPASYRTAIEASRWYSSGLDLTFYTVDPLVAHSGSAPAAELTHVVIVDGALEEKPSMTADVDPATIGPLGGHSLVQSLQIARLTQGAPIASCDAIERWVLQ